MNLAEKRSKKQFEGKNDQYVIDTLISCSDAIHNLECYSCNDLALNMRAEIELNRRGYEVSRKSTIEVKKVEEI